MIKHPTVHKLKAIGWVRGLNAKESGGSQPHLFETEAGLYMVKAKNNPQTARVLANELVGGLCLHWLGVKSPDPAIIDLSEEVLAINPQARFHDGRPLEAGLSFGSQYWQSEPQGTVEARLICNKDDVAGTLTYDTWIRQFDSRQYRVRAAPSDPGYYEMFPVDQGHSFGNPGWTPATLDAQHAKIDIPQTMVVLTDVEMRPPIDRLDGFKNSDAVSIVDQVPGEWLSADEKTSLTRYLVERAKGTVIALRQRFSGPGGA